MLSLRLGWLPWPPYVWFPLTLCHNAFGDLTMRDIIQTSNTYERVFSFQLWRSTQVNNLYFSVVWLNQQFTLFSVCIYEQFTLLFQLYFHIRRSLPFPAPNRGDWIAMAIRNTTSSISFGICCSRDLFMIPRGGQSWFYKTKRQYHDYIWIF